MNRQLFLGFLVLSLVTTDVGLLRADHCLCSKQRNQSRTTYTSSDRTGELLNALRLIQAEAAARSANASFRSTAPPNSRMARASAVLDQLSADLNIQTTQGRSASNARSFGLDPLFLLQLAESVLPSLTQFHSNQIDEFQFAGSLTKTLSEFLQKHNVQSSSSPSTNVAESIKHLQADLNQYYADRDNIDKLLKTLTETVNTQKPSVAAQPAASPTVPAKTPTGTETQIPGDPR
jgi:hypothetical protein